MALEWNGRPCRISRWRRISLAPAGTMQICVVYLPTRQVRFPDSPIQHTLDKRAGRRTSSKSSLRSLYGDGSSSHPSVYKRTSRGCPVACHIPSTHRPRPGPCPPLARTPAHPNSSSCPSLPPRPCMPVSCDPIRSIFPLSHPFCISQSRHRGTPDCRKKRFPPDLSPVCYRLSPLHVSRHATFGSRCSTFDASSSCTSTTVSQSS